MNEIIKTKMVSRGFAEIPEDIILEELPKSRLIFRAQIHSGGVRGKLIRQRRESTTDVWVSEKAIPISSLGKNETINLDLHTSTLTKFYGELSRLKQLLKDKGVEYGENSYVVADPDKVLITDKNKARFIKKLLDQGYSKEIWEDLVDLDPDLATRLSIGRVQVVRTKSLKTFEQNFNRVEFEKYKAQVNRANTKDEVIWQEFFKQNNWIFGYGLDYRFNMILQKEFHASDSEADGSETVIGDYLLGDKKFTTFVELKLPDTPLFGTSKVRSGCWQLSSELNEAVSQLLEQKASGELKIETSKELHDGDGEIIGQRSYNSKVILVIGNWSQIENDDAKTKAIKEKTLELYRRELKNIEIITYDELLERAKFIVTNTATAK